MSNKESESRKFSFEPEVLKYSEKDQRMVAVDSLHYVALASASFGNLFYTPKTNQYWVAEGKECPKEKLESLLPYMSWNFDKFEEETEIVESSDKDSKRKLEKRATGRVINVFPPSPENIALKRRELIEESLNKGVEVDYKEIYAKTSPTKLDISDRMKSKLIAENMTKEDQLIHRLNRTSRI